MTINELRDLAHEIAASKGFWDSERNVGEMLMLVVSELGEAVEAHRKGMFANHTGFALNSFGKDDMAKAEAFKEFMKDTFEDEIADAVIRLLDLCGGLGIDLDAHISAKLAFNATRERLHGKKY